MLWTYREIWIKIVILKEKINKFLHKNNINSLISFFKGRPIKINNK